MVSRVIPVEEFDLVIFGVTGDLSMRKILPALYRRYHAGQLPKGARILGAAHSPIDTDEIRRRAKEAIEAHVSEGKRGAGEVDEFLTCLRYVLVDATTDDGWDTLKSLVRTDVVQAFYLSVGPSLFAGIATRLMRYDIARPEARIVVEKPFGHDLETARNLNAVLKTCFREDQIYRIDHYLGKETVQNLMAVRFGNMLFEPLWNAQYVDHIQITVAETVGVDGRGAYYDRAGALRDMVQNHLMQLICLIAMEPPSTFSPDPVRDEKLKVIRALDQVKLEDVVRGQYLAGSKTASYLEDSGNLESTRESFVALKLNLSNWRWKGTPFYVRTGKRLKARASEIAVTFKDPPHSIFGNETPSGNVLVIRLQPDEGMTMHVTIKEPGPGGMRLVGVPLDMSFAEALGETGSDIPDAYERLITDVIRGNQTLFMRGDEVEAAWEWIDPLLEQVEDNHLRPASYEAGSSGPDDALMLLHKDGRRWREIK
ncbi:MAG: glucose-6-phosphate dehydrogenase [Halocynthiibacter sp.]